MAEPEPAKCERCGNMRQIVWCPAWGEHLCPDCRTYKAEQALRYTGHIAHLMEPEPAPEWLGPVP